MVHANRGFLSGLTCLVSLLYSVAISAAEVALIIDDLGLSRDQDLWAIATPAPVGLSFLPESGHASRGARLADMAGHTVMLHMPMQAEDDSNRARFELRTQDSRHQWQEHLKQALLRVPQATGINNHRGSLLTQSESNMQLLMQLLQNQSLFFIDSRTTPLSQAYPVAQLARIASAERDIFLDSDPAKVAQEIEKWFGLARKYGSAIAIAHPYPETMQALDDLWQQFPDDIILVPVTELLNRRPLPHGAAFTDLRRFIR